LKLGQTPKVPFMERGLFFGYFFAKSQKVTGSLSDNI